MDVQVCQFDASAALSNGDSSGTLWTEEDEGVSDSVWTLSEREKSGIELRILAPAVRSLITLSTELPRRRRSVKNI